MQPRPLFSAALACFALPLLSSFQEGSAATVQEEPAQGAADKEAMDKGDIGSGGNVAWGGFRGNNGCGTGAKAELPATLSEEQIAWRTETPAGYSSPVITRDYVLMTGAEDKKLMTLCYDRNDGSQVWVRELEFDGKRPGANSAAAPSPGTDGERVYCLFHHFGLVAYDMTGKEVWRKELGPFNIPHGMSSSPVLHGDLLLLQVDQDLDSYILAVDKHTGEEKWKTKREGVTHSYATPAVYAPAEGPAQLVVSGSLHVASYSIETGEKLWWVNGSSWMTKSVPVFAGDTCFINAYSASTSEFGLPPMPATWEKTLEEHDGDGDGKIGRSEWEHPVLQQVWFIFDLDGNDLIDQPDYDFACQAAKATGGLFAIKMDGKGDVTDTHVTWRYDDRRGLPDSTSPVIVDGVLYLIKEGSLLSGFDIESGESLKRGRAGNPDRHFASPVAAGGRILTAGLGGELALISGGAEWEVLSTLDLGEEIWSTPALAEGQVFVRTQEALYCLQVPEEG